MTPSYSPSEILEGIEHSMRLPSLEHAVQAFGGVPPALDTPLAERLAWMEQFSERWDYRSGMERNLARDPELSGELETSALSAATDLGLVNPVTPKQSQFDHVIILGGLVRGCITRPQYAARLLSLGSVSAASVVALGAFRALGGNEIGMAAEFLQDDVRDELAAMEAGVKRAFRSGTLIEERGERRETLGASWQVKELATPDGTGLLVVAAPSSEPGRRRANTADAYTWLATRELALEPGQRLLIVTSQIYVPFQLADAQRILTLPFGVEVEVVGTDPSFADPRLVKQFRGSEYLQEIRSTIRSLRMLHASLDATGGRV